MIIKRHKNQKGFTLVEMMVAVSIFVIVAFIVVSTLLTMSYAYKKAQKMRLIMDNFNFALQAMSLNIREGIGYESCNSGDNSCIKLVPIDSWLAGGNTPTVCYSLEPEDSANGINGYIEKCSGACPCNDSNDSISRLTSPDINVQILKFIINDGTGPNLARNKVKIIISGEAGVLAREKTDFFVQNTVSQRNDNNQ